MEKDKIEITYEELQQDQPNQILITAEELAKPPPPRSYQPYTVPFHSKTRQFDLFTILRKGILSGAIGGLIAWVIAEILVHEDSSAAGTTLSVLLEMGYMFALIGGIIGGALGGSEGWQGAFTARVFKGLGIGLAVGLAGGFVGGVCGQLVYGLMGGGNIQQILLQIMVRAFGWAMLGMFIGLGQGLVIPTKKRIINGLLGGLAGGAAGGFLFDPVGYIAGGGTVSRMIAITLLGGCIGAATGLVEQITKEAWLKVVKGLFEGKEYIIYEKITSIGSSGKCSIVLFKDKMIAPRHAEIRIEGNSYCLYDQNSPTGTLVNGVATRRKVLKNADHIQLGETGLIFNERNAGKKGTFTK
jgi:hypothetical protein